jgi:hypothetical protein
VAGRTARAFHSCGSFAAELSDVDAFKRAQTEVCAAKKLTTGAPPPPVFFVRVASKGLMLDAASRLANTGLKLVAFSTICKGLVRVAGKGVRQSFA